MRNEDDVPAGPHSTEHDEMRLLRDPRAGPPVELQGVGEAPVAHEWDYQRKPTRVGLQSELPGLRLIARNGPLFAGCGWTPLGKHDSVVTDELVATGVPVVERARNQVAMCPIHDD